MPFLAPCRRLLALAALVPATLMAQPFEQLDEERVLVDARLIAYLEPGAMAQKEVTRRAASLCLAAGFDSVEILFTASPPGRTSDDGSRAGRQRDQLPVDLVFHSGDGPSSALGCRRSADPDLVKRLRPLVPEAEGGGALAVLDRHLPSKEAERRTWERLWQRFMGMVASLCTENGPRYLELPRSLPAPRVRADDRSSVIGAHLRFEISFDGRPGPRHLECAGLQGPDSKPAVEVVDPVDGYLHLLRAWADGHREAADELFDLQRSLTPSSRCLDDLERSLGEALLDCDPSSLLTVTALQIWSWYRLYVHGALGEADRSLERIRGRLHDVVFAGVDDTAAAFASDLLGYYAAVVSTRRGEEYQHQAVRLLEDSLEFRPDNEDALLVLAHVHELLGDPGRAIRASEAMLEKHPEHREARLRRAVNLGRKSPARAVEPLTAIAREDGPAWMRKIAYFELARLARERGDQSQAVALLREALEALGPSEDILVQLSFVERSRERRDRARRIDSGPLSRVLDDFTGEGGEAARMRYDGGPTESVEGLAERTDRAVTRARSSLRLALDRLDRDECPSRSSSAAPAREGHGPIVDLPSCSGVGLLVLP